MNNFIVSFYNFKVEGRKRKCWDIIFFIFKIYLWKTLNPKIVQKYITIQIIIIIIFKTNLKVDLRWDPSREPKRLKSE
jgi:hypothetical protein